MDDHVVKMSRLRRNLVVWLILMMVSVLVCSTAHAVDAKFKLKPMLTVSGQYDTNYYKTPNDERAVYTFLVAPGIGVGMETARFRVDLNYILEAYFFEDADDVPAGQRAADDDNYIGHVVVFDAAYAPFDRLTLQLNDQFYITRRPVEADRFSNSTERELYYVNRLTPGIFYQITNRFAAGLRYRRTDLRFDKSEEEDYIEHRGMLNLIFNPTRSTTLDLEYQRWNQTSPDNLKDREYNSDFIQLTGEKRFRQFAFEAGVGWHNRDFEDKDFSDEDLLAWKVAATWQNPAPPEQTRFLGRNFMRARTHAYIAFERNFNNLGYYYDNYIATRLTGSLGHVFMHRIRALLRGYYQNSDYLADEGLAPDGTPTGREDDTFDINASIGYIINEMMVVSFVVGFEERDSNINLYDYENTYYTLQFDFNYDIGARGDYGREASYYR